MENFFLLVFHTHTGLKKLSKGLYDSQTQIVPHQKKSKRISLKVKEIVRKQNQTAEERQIAKSKDNEEHICTNTQTKKNKKKTPRGTFHHTGTSWFYIPGSTLPSIVHPMDVEISYLVPSRL